MMGRTMGRGRISVIWGCMFSGKTERLVGMLRAAQAQGREVAAFKHASDDRYCQREIVSHSGHRIEAQPVSDARRILSLLGSASLIAIDEAQFFGPALIEVCSDLADRGCDVIAVGLDLDSWGQPFGLMPQLAEMADEIILTKGLCARCGSVADHTQRLAPVGGQTLVGGPEAYEARCSNCFEAPPAELRR